jgi:hypothetical protein
MKTGSRLSAKSMPDGSEKVPVARVCLALLAINGFLVAIALAALAGIWLLKA